MFGGPQSFTGSDSQTLTMGGGFAPTQSETKKPRVEEKQQILPVTIRAIETALAQRTDTNADLQFHGGAEPSSLLLVAVVESVVRQTASLELLLNDGTGRMKAKYFVSESLPSGLDRVQPGRYVSVVGSIRNTPIVHLGLLCLRPVDSADEISYHFIECAHAALRLQRGSNDTPKMAESWTPQAKLKRSEDAEMTPTPSKEGSTQSMHNSGVQPVTSQACPKPVCSLRDSLVEALRREAEVKGDMGVSATELLSVLCAAGVSGASEVALRKCLVEMVENGEAFNTLDDEHFAPL